MLEAVVEKYTEDSKEEDGEEEVAAEVVAATTPPTRITLEIEPTTSIAAPDMIRGVVVEDPIGETTAGTARGSNRTAQVDVEAYKGKGFKFGEVMRE